MSAPPATYVPHTSFLVLPRHRLSRPRNPVAGDKRRSPVTQPTASSIVPEQANYQGIFTSRGVFATKTKLKASVAANCIERCAWLSGAVLQQLSRQFRCQIHGSASTSPPPSCLQSDLTARGLFRRQAGDLSITQADHAWRTRSGDETGLTA